MCVLSILFQNTYTHHSNGACFWFPAWPDLSGFVLIMLRGICADGGQEWIFYSMYDCGGLPTLTLLQGRRGNLRWTSNKLGCCVLMVWTGRALMRIRWMMEKPLKASVTCDPLFLFFFPIKEQAMVFSEPSHITVTWKATFQSNAKQTLTQAAILMLSRTGVSLLSHRRQRKLLCSAFTSTRSMSDTVVQAFITTWILF